MNCISKPSNLRKMESRVNRVYTRTIFFKRTLQLLSGTSLTLTPLVDVIFLLLIFFMIASSLVFQTGITVNLPETKQELSSIADKLIITVTKENLLFFNDQRLEDWIHLEQRLANVVYNQDTNPRIVSQISSDGSRMPVIILKADKEVPYDSVVKIMSISRRFGLNVFLVTTTSEGP